MAVVLSDTDGESSDVEVIYEEVSLQSKLRQELHMLEILRDSQEPVPASYDAFKARVARLKYTFCPDVVDDVWRKLNDMMSLEKEGKLERNFNRHSLCGRDNCVCYSKLPVVEVIASESETECEETNNDCAQRIKRVQKNSVYETSESKKHVSEAHSCHNESTVEPVKNNRRYVDKHEDCSSDVYSKSHTESMSKEEIKTHKKKTKRTKKEVVNVTQSDCHTNTHSEHTELKSKVNSEPNKTKSYLHKRTHCENYNDCNTVELCSSGNVSTQFSECIPNKETVNIMEVKSDSDMLYSLKRRKKQSQYVTTESNYNENSTYGKDKEEKEHKRSKKGHITDKAMQNTDKVELVGSSNCKDTSDTLISKEKTKKHKDQYGNVASSFHTGVYEMDGKNKSENFSTNSKSEKKKYHQSYEKTINSDNIPNTYTKVIYNKESNNGASKYNKKHNKKVQANSWNDNLSGITKCVYDLIENDMEKEKDYYDKSSNKTGSRHKNCRSHSCSSAKCRQNDKEHSVIIDTHIQIVRSSKSQEKRRNKCDDSVSFPKDDSTSNRKKHKNSVDEKYSTNNEFSEAELKKFIESEKKERRKEKEKIINHEWQLIHDRLVELMAPKLFKQGNFTGNVTL